MDKRYLNKVREIKAITKWSQEKFALAIGVTFATFNRWLNQGVEPRHIYLDKINFLYKQYVGIKPISQKELLRLIKATEKCQIKDIRDKINSNQDLKEELLLDLTYNSNAIEGSTFTLKETQMVLFDKGKVFDKSLIEHLEVINHGLILDDIFKGEYSAELNEKLTKKIHKNLMHGIRADAGEYSKHQRRIKGVDLALPHPEDIPEEMEYLINNRNYQEKKQHYIEYISRFHADFEAIHPFGDGNGRVGRLIMAIQLMKKDYPPVLIENNRKADYYDALENAQRHSYSFLTAFICEEIQKSYDIIKKYIKV